MANDAIRIASGFWLLATGFFLLGCMATRETQNPKEMLPVMGEGKVLSVDQTLGQGTMEVKGKTVTFWWQNRIQMGASGTDKEQLLQSPEAREMTVSFHAQVGDWVSFKGYQMQGEIFITGATVIKK
ncbi:MAG: hypothetical protein FWD61_13520 [Phycisphaerales bacterium]|nr:hypothetical protein [Phycisphaerales bacterium]